MKYIVIELQTNANGAVGNFVWSYDTRNLAEQKYFTVLAAAAVSSLPKHACVILTSEGVLINRQCYEHEEEES